VRERRAGFTLIEILVVLTLLGFLMGLSIGFVQRAGKGNLLLQATHKLHSMLAAARAQAYGTNRAYVAITHAEDGSTVLRNYRSRQVFHWPCEDFTRASEVGVLKQRGGVEIIDPPGAAREGRFARFDGGGEVSLGAPAWLQLVDGFTIECRLRVATQGAGGNMVLFRKGAAIQVRLLSYEPGVFDLEAKIRLQPDAKGEGEGDDLLRTGFRDGAEVPEWKGPLLAGRWYDVKIAYDRNDFTIHVNDRLRGRRSDRRNRMQPNDDPFLIGGGYTGDFDSLVIGGIFEDDDDRCTVPEQVTWVDAKDTPRTDSAFIHFRNSLLDPHYHAQAVRLIFVLETGETLARGAHREVTVSLSGEASVHLTGEE